MNNWNGKMKALTFSYDDGVTTDAPLIAILNRYGMKGTFNLNSATHPASGDPRMERIAGDGKTTIARLYKEELKPLYEGHEVALHALTHPFLTKCTPEACRKEIAEDKQNLEAMFGYTPIGMAYPFGDYNDAVVEILAENGIRYSRTTISTHAFDVPTGLLQLPATCHHNDDQLMALAERFLAMESDTPQLFYVWGHSYEFADRDNWDVIERFCEKLAGRDDIFYGTNADVLL